jgi:protein gp37
MANSSDIEWTNATWNPVAGCTIVSPGCTNCYAMRMASRLQAMGQEKYQGTTRRSGKRAVWTGRIRTDDASLSLPMTWKAPKRIFVNSMSDLFHDSVPESFILRVWDVMAETPRHTFQILTKRPSRMAEIVGSSACSVLPNVWLGTSVEAVGQLPRIDELRCVPAAVRFVSFEPLLGSVGSPCLRDIHWAIVGGESGPYARPMDPVWVNEIREACQTQFVAFFFKQWGGRSKKATGRVLDGRTWNEYPASRLAPEVSRAVTASEW